MRDGRTRKIAAGERQLEFTRFLADFRAVIAVLEGPAAGSEYEIEKPRTTLGRGPGVDLAFPDPSMSKQHACVEWAGGDLRLGDLGSTNGVRVNGAVIVVAELKHGDRFQLGEHVFQFVLERRRKEPRTYVLPDQ